MIEAILIKLGGSLITDKSLAESPRLPVIRRLAAEIAGAAQAGLRLIVGHGSGSFGHVAAARYRLSSGLTSVDQLAGVSLTQERAAALHQIVRRELLAAGARPFSLAPSSALVTEGAEPAAFLEEPLCLALSHGLLPVLYGDVVLDRGQGVAICSTERLFTLLAQRLPERGVVLKRALWLGETPGVWDGEGRVLPHLNRAAFDRQPGLFRGAAGTDVTGGMRHRVETGLTLADLGITSQILDGRVPGLLGQALAGAEVPGTVIGPAPWAAS